MEGPIGPPRLQSTDVNPERIGGGLYIEPVPIDRWTNWGFSSNKSANSKPSHYNLSSAPDTLGDIVVGVVGVTGGTGGCIRGYIGLVMSYPWLRRGT